MSDLFGALGGLAKGISNLMPQDDPNTKIFRSQAEMAELKKKQRDIYVEIGQKAVELYGLDAFGELGAKMREVEAQMQAADSNLQAANAEQKQAEAALEARTCPNCGCENAEGTKFCQECGTQLGTSFCPSCGAQNEAGAKFCNSCGTPL